MRKHQFAILVLLVTLLISQPVLSQDGDVRPTPDSGARQAEPVRSNVLPVVEEDPTNPQPETTDTPTEVSIEAETIDDPVFITPEATEVVTPQESEAIMVIEPIEVTGDGLVVITPEVTEAVVLVEVTEAVVPVEVTEAVVPVEVTEAVVPVEVTEAVVPVEVTVEVTEEATAPELATEGDGVEMIINYDPKASEESIQAMLRTLGATEVDRLPEIGSMRVIMNADLADGERAANAISQSTAAREAGLRDIEPNRIRELTFIPNDPEYSNQYYLHNDAAGTYVESAWDISLRQGYGVIVAVVDSGVDLQHPDLRYRLLPGYDFYNDDYIPDDTNEGPGSGHGTAVASIIAGNRNNGIGVAGIAPAARILPVKVCGGGACPVYELAAGIIYAVDRGAHIINVSIGGLGYSTTEKGAIDYALARNVIVIISAGNSGVEQYEYPASYEGVISVGATDEFGDIAAFSTINDRVDVSAPGVDIVTAYPIEFGSYTYLSGTSFSAPIVSGIAALLVSDRIATTPATVREALICSALDKGATGYDIYYGHGFVQADLALTWSGNSADCQVSQPNDYIYRARRLWRLLETVTQPVDVRSVTESEGDPTICGVAPQQTLWYTYTAPLHGTYQISTFGSSYNTLLGVYEGMPGSLDEIACSDDAGPNENSQLYLELRPGVVYYIQVGTDDGVDITGVMSLNITRAFLNSLAQQEFRPEITYSGTWNRVPQVGASGYFVNRTTDNGATASFVARGNTLQYRRTVGPDRGAVQFWIDDDSPITISNRAAVTRVEVETISLGSTATGEWHRVVMARDPASFGSIDIDYFRVFDDDLPLRVVFRRENETSYVFFDAFRNGTWLSALQEGALGNNVIYTSTQDAYVQFRAIGSFVTFYRNTGLGTGTMEIYVNNVLYDTVDNSLLPDGVSVPYTIANLPYTERVIRVVHTSATGTFYFDGARAGNQPTYNPPYRLQEFLFGLVYSGQWQRVVDYQASGYWVTLAQSPDARVEFMFRGNHLCIGYQQRDDGSTMEVYIDDVNYATIDTNGPLLNQMLWCTYDNGINLLSDTVHNVRLEAPNASESTPVALDFVQPQRQVIFTTHMGYIHELRYGIYYDVAYGSWARVPFGSAGGYRYQGYWASRAGTNGERLSFTMNGTGFVIYTSIAPEAGAWEVWVDGIKKTFVFLDVNYDYLDLYNDWRFRPVALAVTDLAPGIHVIELRTTTSPDGGNEFVDFDGIRVLP